MAARTNGKGGGGEKGVTRAPCEKKSGAGEKRGRRRWPTLFIATQQGDGEGPPVRLAGGGWSATARPQRLWVVRVQAAHDEWEQRRKGGPSAWATVCERGPVALGRPKGKVSFVNYSKIFKRV
jgi:hypothetical protein